MITPPTYAVWRAYLAKCAKSIRQVMTLLDRQGGQCSLAGLGTSRAVKLRVSHSATDPGGS